MGTRLRSPRSGLIRAPKRLSSWEGSVASGTNGSGQTLASSAATLFGTSFLFTSDVTIVRQRGEFLAFLESATATADGLFGAIGIAKASTAAVTAGAASVPTPITEESWDGWLYHRYFSLMAPAPIAGGAAADGDLSIPTTAAVRIEVDSKAMRKIGNLESLYGAIELTLIGTASMRVFFNSRMLVKLA